MSFREKRDFPKSLNSYYRVKIKSSRVRHQSLPQREIVQNTMQERSQSREQVGTAGTAGREIQRDAAEEEEGEVR